MRHPATHLDTVLQHASPPFTALHRPATRCTTMHHTAPRCTTPHHTAPHHTTLHHTAPHCNALQYTAGHHITLPHKSRSKTRAFLFAHFGFKYRLYSLTHCTARYTVTLQHKATNSNTQQHAATHCNTLPLFVGSVPT